ncbi:ArnT family glycosyltransferase [Aphanothece sacrum]|uniref:Glycosyl transferase n=1 Tax=Aphanothece sacrum FPU1 TaxID=1920663 RepID=A0A401IBM0_APHSA|nr:phospholipid carrier-dependent glycosyltransferase [Aphanothece sacrum]GBF78642.1 glycosyl transferase [Aphanothece sacrum FPU1]GBF84931.1 glycosyl transferase [Aphanothece sacrum FPU3]
MDNLTFFSYSSQTPSRQGERWRELFFLGGLFLAAFLLFTFNLGNLPLLNPEETIIAKIAQEIGQYPLLSGGWLFPTLGGEPYHQYPFLGPFLISLAYLCDQMTEWTTRFPGAFLGAISVPLLYGVGREIFVKRLPALLSALIYLTLFPVIHQGRLGMMDGVILFWEILTVFCLLRSRRNLRWSLGVGLSLSGLLLTQGTIGGLLGLTIFLFLAWDIPRLLSSRYFWAGMSLGLLPAMSWYGVQWAYYGQSFGQEMFLKPLQNNWKMFSTDGLFYIMEMVKYSLPWLIFAFYGWQLARKSLMWGWAKLIILWGIVYLLNFLLIPGSPIRCLIPLCPPLALAGGIALTEVYNGPSSRSYPQSWAIILLALSGLITLVCLTILLNFPFDWSYLHDQGLVSLNLAAVALTFGTTAMLIWQRNAQFIAVLIWGMYVSLLLFMSSSHWGWSV